MKKTFFVLLVSMASLAVGAQQINDPNVQKREIGAFHGISVSNAFDVYLTQSNVDELAVSASTAEYRDRIRTKVENGILKISFDNEKKLLRRNDKLKLKVYISFRDIDQLDVSGACDVEIIGTIKADKLKVELSGASDIHGRLEVGDLEIDLSGASDMRVSGTAGTMKLDANGASEFKGYEMAADNLNVDASGASGVTITVNKELSARISGASDLDYRGNAVTKEVKISGASSISKKS